MPRLSGAHGQVLMDPSGGASPVAIANVNKWTLNIKTDRYDATAFGDANKVKTLGLADISGTISAFYDGTDLTLFTTALGIVAPFLKLVANSLSATTFFSGLAWLDANINVDVKGNITSDGTFDAAGAWALTHP